MREHWWPDDKKTGEMTLEQGGAVAQATRVAHVLPDVRSEVQKLTEDTQRRAIQALREGKLTPDLALMYWQEVSGWQTLLRRLETRVKVGGAVVDQHPDEFQLGDE